MSRSLSSSKRRGGASIKPRVWWRVCRTSRTITSRVPTRWRTTSDCTRLCGGTRTQVAGADVPVASGTWHSLKLVVQGPQFQVFLNDTLLFNSQGTTTITAAGKVGLWTKADSVTYFDDLSIVSD